MGREKRLIFAVVGMMASVIAFILVCLAIEFSSPLRRPESDIRNDILSLTPIGTSMDDVLAVINRKVNSDGWRIRIIRHDTGYADYSRRGFPVVGEQSIIVDIGRSFMGWVAVDIAWGFDEDGNLIDVYVRKHNTFLT